MLSRKLEQLWDEQETTPEPPPAVSSKAVDAYIQSKHFKRCVAAYTCTHTEASFTYDAWLQACAKGDIWQGQGGL